MVVKTKQSSEVESPCIRQCCLNEEDVCLGCYRALEEILAWSSSTLEEKKAIILRCRQRRSALDNRN
ncbi:DUF1289 domain-containing protein [Vibrio sp. S4M6]|uniref:DUF1289 domain-containing protein n=1 Tax=Vibrio sinus TaxID=2946865 RepID=UPI00202A3559|nr:DUF1289 domain-containing protein [Vibrio sinus]MCL9780848.1 DUF1289 domain-containing protein [Vibrio sinus]